MTIHVAILEDHQGIIDGYLYRLETKPAIKIVGTAMTGEELEPLLAKQPVNVLLADIYVPVSAKNRSPYPVLQAIPGLLQKYPNLHILVISMVTLGTLVQAMTEAGVSGYIFKDDQASIQKLAAIVEMVADGGAYYSPGAHYRLRKQTPGMPQLTSRQVEILLFCASHPELTTEQIALRLNIANSTVRNLLTKVYNRLGVHNRASALTRAQQLGLLPVNQFDTPTDEAQM